MRTIIPGEVDPLTAYTYLVGTVTPRPIALVSSVAADGTVNLAPYSFFNAFGANPPILVFSAIKRNKSLTYKDTYHNVVHHPEVVISLVSHEMVQQMSITSGSYPADVSEFAKAGFTPIPSEVVKPPRVQEAPAQFECIVRKIESFGDGGISTNLIICEAVRMHFSEHIFDENDKIDPQRLDIMGRLGRAYYIRASGPNVFPIIRPSSQLVLGFDGLPDYVRHSPVLTGNELAQLAGVAELPNLNDSIRQDPEVMNALAGNAQMRDQRLHLHAQSLIQQGKIQRAWQVLLMGMEG